MFQPCVNDGTLQFFFNTGFHVRWLLRNLDFRKNDDTRWWSSRGPPPFNSKRHHQRHTFRHTTQKCWVTGMSLGGVWQVWTKISFDECSKTAPFLTATKHTRALSPKFCLKSGHPQPPPFHKHARDRKRSFFAYLQPSATMYPPTGGGHR